MTIPDQYHEYLNAGGESEFEVDLEFGSYIILEPIDEIEQFNSDIEIDIYAPGYLAFASDGGGEAFAFNKEGAIFSLPLVGMSQDEAKRIADSWTEFESKKIKTL